MSFCSNFKFAFCTLQFAIISLSLAIIATPANGDEGMWLFTNPPTKILKQQYDFTPTQDWLRHVQHSSVRFNAGGSASFVSADGLVMTNHHVGADALQKFSSEEHDYLKNGFYAKTREEELKCADQELNVLISIEDVTAKVNAAVPPGLDMAAAEKARRAVMNTIEKESTDKTGLRSDVITLIQRRRISSIPVQKIYRRPPGVRPRAGYRLFRRRSRQFRISPLRSRHLFLPRLRRRQAGKDRTISEMESGRPERQRVGLRLRKSRKDRPAGYDGPFGIHPRQGFARPAQSPAPPRGAPIHLQPAQRRKRPPGERRPVRRAELAQSPHGHAGRTARSGRDDHARCRRTIVQTGRAEKCPT